MSTSGAGYKLNLTPYVNGALLGTLTVVAANGGYARYSNLSAAKSIWSDAPTTGDKGGDLVPTPSAAMISVATQSVRARTNTAPTASEGVLWPTGTVMMISNELDLLKALQLIETTTTAEVTIQYFYEWGA